MSQVFGRHTFRPKNTQSCDYRLLFVARLWINGNALLNFSAHFQLAYLRDTCQTNQVAEETDDCDKDLLAATQQLWPFIDHCRNETFHGTEL